MRYVIKYCCNECKKEISPKEFIADDGSYLCSECSKDVIPASEEFLARIEIVSTIRHELGFYITDCPEKVSNFDITSENDFVLYDFVFEGIRYHVKYLKGQRIVEFLSIK